MTCKGKIYLSIAIVQKIVRVICASLYFTCSTVVEKTRAQIARILKGDCSDFFKSFESADNYCALNSKVGDCSDALRSVFPTFVTIWNIIRSRSANHILESFDYHYGIWSMRFKHLTPYSQIQ